MLRKTVEIATPGTRLSVAAKQLVIERPDHPRKTLPIEDIGVLVVDDRRASYTHAVGKRSEASRLTARLAFVEWRRAASVFDRT